MNTTIKNKLTESIKNNLIDLLSSYGLIINGKNYNSADKYHNLYLMKNNTIKIKDLFTLLKDNGLMLFYSSKNKYYIGNVTITILDKTNILKYVYEFDTDKNTDELISNFIMNNFKVLN